MTKRAGAAQIACAFASAGGPAAAAGELEALLSAMPEPTAALSGR